jgi:hypothetical protein
MFFIVKSNCSDTVKPSVTAFESIINGPFAQFVAASGKIGGDVQAQVK